jgi:hypothetical protein
VVLPANDGPSPERCDTLRLVTASPSIEAFIEATTSAGWRVERRDRSQALALPVEITQRYGPLPPSYHEFLCEVAEATTADGTVWLLCEGEFHRNDPEGFVWNQIEKMSLESAADDEERRAIVSFWDRHLPIMMAPNGDYDYLAIALSEAERGNVVHSFAPYWEEPRHVADSFDDWLVMLSQALRDPAFGPHSPLVLRIMSHRG